MGLQPTKPGLGYSDLLTGDSAVDKMVQTWQHVGMGKVDLSADGCWLIIKRGGGDYTLFLSMVDSTAVAILDDDAVPRHIPEELRPDAELEPSDAQMVSQAFADAAGGSFPRPDDGVFVITTRSSDGYGELHIGLSDDTLQTTDRA